MKPLRSLPALAAICVTAAAAKTGQAGPAPKPAGHSIGLMCDPRCDLAWAVDSNWRVKGMRFDPKTAEFSAPERKR